MPTPRPPIEIPALFPGASERLSEERDALVAQATALTTRIRAFGEESCRRGELHVRRRLDALLRRYLRETAHQKDVWSQRAAAPGDASRASSMAALFAQLLETVDPTPNLKAIEQLERLLDFNGARAQSAAAGLRAQCGIRGNGEG